MTSYTLALAQPTATLDTVGGKGLSLVRLLAAGLPVPGGFHITTAAYRRFVAENDLQPRILQAAEGADADDPAALETASQRIRALFDAGTIPAAVAAALSEAYAPFDGAPVAVRSSATAEDLPGASFAGQQESYLNVRGRDALLAAVRACWASLWTARALAYRRKNNIAQESVALAVVVQEMVAADAAGILFTANPVSGARGEMLINAAWGLGEAIVSGAVTPDTLVVEKASGRLLQRETADKAIMTLRTEQGTRDVPVPASQRGQAVLSDGQAAELARMGLRIEQLYGMPMDIEWARAEGAFFVVQARPITALPPAWERPDPKALYTRASLAEHTPSPVSPLFGTLGLEFANEATLRIYQRMVGSRAPALMAEGGYYQPLNGYVYYAIRTGGRNMLTLARMTAQAGPILRGSVARWQAGRKQLAAMVEEWERTPPAARTPSELLAGVRSVVAAACTYYTVIQTVLPAASSAEVLFTTFYERLIRRRQEPPAATFLLGFETMAVRAEQSLFDLAAWVRSEPALVNHLFQRSTHALAAEIVQESPPHGLPDALWSAWRQRFGRHMETYGRTAYEFDFANPTPQETPGPLLDTIKAFLAGQAEDPHARRLAAVARREQATQAVLERTGWPRRGIFLRLLRWAQETGPMREDSIFDLGMGHPLIRRLLGELGLRFAAAGALAEQDDIYWLEQSELGELVAALERGAPLADCAARIPARKQQWQAALRFSPPLILPERTSWQRLMQGGEARRIDGKLVLKGVGTSGGRVTAPARVLFGPEDFNALQPGDILVAVTTTPAWTPLFARAAAVVTDIGGPLSHSSIVAREYGIPAVMAARSATRAIHSGCMITVDGSAGTVTLDEQPGL